MVLHAVLQLVTGFIMVAAILGAAFLIGTALAEAKDALAKRRDEKQFFNKIEEYRNDFR